MAAPQVLLNEVQNSSPRQVMQVNAMGITKWKSLIIGFHLLSMVVSRVLKLSPLGKSKVSKYIEQHFDPARSNYK